HLAQSQPRRVARVRTERDAPLGKLADRGDEVHALLRHAGPRLVTDTVVVAPLAGKGDPLDDAELDEQADTRADGRLARLERGGKFAGRLMRRLADEQSANHPRRHPWEPGLLKDDPDVLDIYLLRCVLALREIGHGGLLSWLV